MITVSSKAADELKKELTSHDAAYLRLAIAGGGCSGFQYMIRFELERDPNDTLIQQHGLRILIDPISARYLNGATIELNDPPDPLAPKFAIRNPNAKSTCGCGSSFEPQ